MRESFHSHSICEKLSQRKDVLYEGIDLSYVLFCIHVYSLHHAVFLLTLLLIRSMRSQSLIQHGSPQASIVWKMNDTEQSSNMADQVVNLLVEAQDGQLSKLANTISLSFEATLERLLKRQHPVDDDLPQHTSAKKCALDNDQVSLHADEGIDGLIADVNAEAENAQNSQVTEEPTIFDEEDSFLNALTAEFNEEEATSPGISPKLAAVTGKIWQDKFKEEQAKARLNRYERPENCDNLQVQKVNPEIWNSVLLQYRTSDIKIQKLQSIICKVTVPMLQCADTFMTQKSWPKMT